MAGLEQLSALNHFDKRDKSGETEIVAGSRIFHSEYVSDVIFHIGKQAPKLVLVDSEDSRDKMASGYLHQSNKKTHWWGYFAQGNVWAAGLSAGLNWDKYNQLNKDLESKAAHLWAPLKGSSPSYDPKIIGKRNKADKIAILQEKNLALTPNLKRENDSEKPSEQAQRSRLANVLSESNIAKDAETAGYKGGRKAYALNLTLDYYRDKNELLAHLPEEKERARNHLSLWPPKEEWKASGLNDAEQSYYLGVEKHLLGLENLERQLTSMPNNTKEIRRIQIMQLWNPNRPSLVKYQYTHALNYEFEHTYVFSKHDPYYARFAARQRVISNELDNVFKYRHEEARQKLQSDFETWNKAHNELRRKMLGIVPGLAAGVVNEVADRFITSKEANHYTWSIDFGATLLTQTEIAEKIALKIAAGRPLIASALTIGGLVATHIAALEMGGDDTDMNAWRSPSFGNDYLSWLRPKRTSEALI